MGNVDSSASPAHQLDSTKSFLQDAEFPDLGDNGESLNQYEEEGDDHNHYKGSNSEDGPPDVNADAIAALLPDTSTGSVPDDVLHAIAVANKDVHRGEYEIAQQAVCTGMAKYTCSQKRDNQSTGKHRSKCISKTENRQNCNSQGNEEILLKAKKKRGRQGKVVLGNCEHHDLIHEEEPLEHIMHGAPNVSPDSGIQSNSGSPFYPDPAGDQQHVQPDMDICEVPLADEVVPLAYHQSQNQLNAITDKPNCNVAESVKMKRKYVRTKPLKSASVVKSKCQLDDPKSIRSRGRPKGSKNKAKNDYPVTSVEVHSVQQASPLQAGTGTANTVQHLKHMTQHQLLAAVHPTTTVYTTVTTMYSCQVGQNLQVSNSCASLQQHTHGQSHGEAVHRKALGKTPIKDTIDFRHIADHVTQKELKSDNKKKRGRKKSYEHVSPLNVPLTISPPSNVNISSVANKSCDESEMHRLMSCVKDSINEQFEEENTTDFGLSADSMDNSSDYEISENPSNNAITSIQDKCNKSKKSITKSVHVTMHSQKKRGRKKKLLPSAVTLSTSCTSTSSQCISSANSTISGKKPSPTSRVTPNEPKPTMFCRGGPLKLTSYGSNPPTLAPVEPCSTTPSVATNLVIDTAGMYIHDVKEKSVYYV